MFDFSNYPLDSKFFDPVNKKVIGKMKNEFKRKTISGFIGLKSKTYSFTQGVNEKIRHKEFVDVLFNKKVRRDNMKRIQSKLYRTGTYDVCKISLSCFHNKRYVLDDSVNTLTYFYKDMKD